MDFNIDGSVCSVLVEKEVSIYHDWTTLILDPEAEKVFCFESGGEMDVLLYHANGGLGTMMPIPCLDHFFSK